MIKMRCPGPLFALGEDLESLDQIFERFGLKSPPGLPIPAESVSVEVENPAMAAIGQEHLTVTPMQVALAMAVLAEGRLPTARLVEGVRNENVDWDNQLPARSDFALPIISPAAGEAILETWPVIGRASEFSVAVLSGPAGSHNAWYIGVAPRTNPRYVLAILSEDTDATTIVENIGRELLATLP
jgi:cell division protein FtsI/penicillin-binding protein 2